MQTRLGRPLVCRELRERQSRRSLGAPGACPAPLAAAMVRRPCRTLSPHSSVCRVAPGLRMSVDVLPPLCPPETAALGGLSPPHSSPGWGGPAAVPAPGAGEGARGLCSPTASSPGPGLGLAEARSWRGCPDLCNFLSNKAALRQPCCPAAALLPGPALPQPGGTSPAPLREPSLLLWLCPGFSPPPSLCFPPCSGLGSLCYCVPLSPLRG